jgi:hypothetical protein
MACPTPAPSPPDRPHGAGPASSDKKPKRAETRSRLALAVPFIGKDVPSPSAEFAHPDVLIGLSVLAYR